MLLQRLHETSQHSTGSSGNGLVVTFKGAALLMLVFLCLAATAGLSSHLRTLYLQASRDLFYSGSESLQHVLPQLTVLTRLQVGEVPDASIFQHAPQQLQELKAVGVEDRSIALVSSLHLLALSCRCFILLSKYCHAQSACDARHTAQQREWTVPPAAALPAAAAACVLAAVRSSSAT
jgi:hypothetical protein